MLTDFLRTKDTHLVSVAGISSIVPSKTEPQVEHLPRIDKNTSP